VVSKARPTLIFVASPRTQDASAGAAAAALALGVSELAAGLFAGFPSLIEGLGNWVIDIVPKPIKDWAIGLFGTNDKLALLIGIGVVAIGIGALVGPAARARFGLATTFFVGFGLVAALAAARDPQMSLAIAIVPGGLAALTGLGVLHRFLGLRPRPGTEGDPGDSSRRSFIIGVGAVVGVAALAGGLGRVMLERGKRAAAGRFDVSLPSPAETVPPVSPAAELGVEGLSPVITPNADFYRIDTAFAVPRIALQDWTLSVTGRVNRPFSISYYDLLDMRMVERHITLSCVSNEIGGDLVGNAKWLGVPLTEILDRADLQPGAEQLVGRSVDNFTIGFPVEAAYDGREALVAVGMNDEPLPFEHGFPARLVVSGLYGYVSATKWLSEIELTGWDDFDAYWIPRGWAKEAPIKTQSRIDAPREARHTSLGELMVAGVAWAPNRGISQVEVQLGDDAPWVDAELSEPLSNDTWRQWKLMWDAPPGRHTLTVRATDGEGNLQTSERRRPAPDGATGWHSRVVVIEEV
jgi:DMSO/TMAO reductase YedYZ molybdopterin-dependent catalytic subunit